MSTCVLTPEPGSPSSPENHLSMVTLGPETSTQKVNIHRLTMCPLSVLFSVLQEENLHVLFITSYGTHLYIPSHLFSLLW